MKAICKAVMAGRLDLDWLDLRWSNCDATPYLDGEGGGLAYWRMPMLTHELLGKYGLQKWMTLGSGRLEDEGAKLIRTADYPPSRYQYL